MATQRFYIDPDNSAGTDYLSLNAFVSGEVGDMGGDHVFVYCQSSDNTADTTECSITGFSNYASFTVLAYPGKEHLGYWPNGGGQYTLVVTDPTSSILAISNSDIKLNGLCVELDNTTTGTKHAIRATNSNNAILCHNIVRGANGDGGVGTGARWGIYLQNVVTSNTAFVHNNIVYDLVEPADLGVGIYLQQASGTLTVHLAHNTVQNCTVGYEQSGATVNAKNCGAASCGTGFKGTISQTTCSSTAPTFQDVANDKFLLDFFDTTWKGQGTDLRADATFPINQDIHNLGIALPYPIGVSQGIGNMARPFKHNFTKEFDTYAPQIRKDIIA